MASARRDSLAGVSALELPPTPESVPEARAFVRETLRATSVDVDTAMLLVSEVTTNAVLHARTSVTVQVQVTGDVVRVEVTDGSPAVPRIHSYGPTSATGRGLRLVDQLARSWGVRDDPDGGKVVWFEVGAPSESAWAELDGGWLVEGATYEQ